MQRYTIIGITDAAEPQLSAEAREAVAAGRVFSGGRRHHEIVRPLLPAQHEWIDIAPPMEAVLARYAACEGEVVVFASGDPLFFGFAATLLRAFPGGNVRVLPAFNSLQLLAHRLLLPYERMHCVSLVGRPWEGLDRALLRGEELVGVLVDRAKRPELVAQRLLDYGYEGYTMSVGERLGGEQERVRTLSLHAALTETFAAPCCLLLRSEGALPPRPFGIPDYAFALLDGRERMITKMPIRLLSLQALDLPRRHVLWDVGFCTGSISIEARRLFPHLHIVAIERRAEGEALMATNSRRFGAPGIETLIGDFFSIETSGLPVPDAVFIGGHGGRLPEMMARLDGLVAEGARVALNAVTPQSRSAFEDNATRLGWRLNAPLHVELNDFHPITILTADVYHSR